MFGCVATKSDIRFKRPTHGSAYIRKYFIYDDYISNSKRQDDNNIFFICDETVVQQAFNMTIPPKNRINLNLGERDFQGTKVLFPIQC